MAQQKHLAPGQLPDLMRVMLVIVLLSGHYALAQQANSTDAPQPAPGAVTTIEYERQPPLQYTYDSNKSLTEPEDNIRTSSKPVSSSNESTQDVRQSADLIEATTIPPPTTTPSLPASTPSPTPSATNSQQPFCTLGDDTFQIGERWNPNLPPFGVQVCVICECTIRQRKNCYETKTTCRRITNECPVIDSCPDGKKPITVAGQCCKSCQSSNLAQQESNSQVQQQQSQTLGNQSPTYESQASRGDQQQTSFKIVYMNERTKEYLSIMKNLPACPNRDSESRLPPANAPTIPTPSLTMPSKAPKGGRNDLNGIDTKLAFKSLSDTATNYLMPSKNRQDDSNKRVESSSSDDNRQQHPNDVQSAASSNNNNLSPQNTYGRKNQYNSSDSSHNCVLGNDTFQVGDIWNPILPPFGVQLCVRCQCIYRLRKGCYETKLTCRRVNKDCPVIESCPDGRAPVTVSGQCCKSCPTLIDNVEQQPTELTNDTVGAIIPPYVTLDGIQRNEKVYREFQTASRNLNVCIKTRESSDIYGVNRFARRSRRSGL